MPFCDNCGKPVYPLDKVCSNCGAPVTPAPLPAPANNRPAEPEPPQGSPYAVLGSWGFVGSILLLGLPIAGFIIAIVWAAGGTVNLNRRNLARGYLIILGLVAALYILLVIAIVAFGGSALLLNNIIQ
ncbi:MAG: hypothetical protein GX417_12795 [Clostridiales bacterium]|nr:hypothetical protein [Clostridiales bacterium]